LVHVFSGEWSRAIMAHLFTSYSIFRQKWNNSIKGDENLYILFVCFWKMENLHSLSRIFSKALRYLHYFNTNIFLCLKKLKWCFKLQFTFRGNRTVSLTVHIVSSTSFFFSSIYRGYLLFLMEDRNLNHQVRIKWHIITSSLPQVKILPSNVQKMK